MSYEQMAKEKLARFDDTSVLLAIESSCDETAAAVVRGREVLSSVIHSQIPLHQIYGGVVPEIASRSHVEKVGHVCRKALLEAKLELGDIGAVAVTCGPGLIGALLVGVAYAKGLAYASELPLVGVNHIAGHIAANYISHPSLEPPFVCLVVSGGHSHIVLVKDYCEYELIGRTRDDAAGETFDKIARVLGLPYPGGPNLEKLALGGDEHAIRFSAPFNESKENYDFSFSGIKTKVINYIHTAKQRGEEMNKADVAASFQAEVAGVLCEKAVRAAKQWGVDRIALAGGVSANGRLRAALQVGAETAGLECFVPQFAYCTDNAAMIGCQGYFMLQRGLYSTLELNAQANLQLI